MSDELQHLLSRIEREGIEKAETRAADIVSEAEARAAQILKDAEAKAETLEARGRTEAEALEARSRAAVHQASRDVIRSVANTVTRMFERILAARTGDVLDGKVLAELVVAVVKAYAEADASGSGMDIQVSKEQSQALTQTLADGLAEAMRDGITVQPRGDIVKGFRVVLRDGNVEHDFTAEAIAEALGESLRPELAALIKDGEKA